MSPRLSAALQHLVPQRLCCRFIYRLARSRRPWLKRLLITSFERLYAIDLDEAEIVESSAYPSFNAFFTRALKAGARPLDGDEDTIVSPADGRVTEFGRIKQGRLLQAKGRSYSLADLLGEPDAIVEPFRGGAYLTVYLAPHNYHRVHAPLAGRIERARFIPGSRFSVNASTVQAIDSVFCRNERVVLWLATAVGPCAVVMVGALNVSSLTTVLTGEIPSGQARVFAATDADAITRGGELGRFNLGSTIVLLFPAGAAEWLPALEHGQAIRMGQRLGRAIQRGR